MLFCCFIVRNYFVGHPGLTNKTSSQNCKPLITWLYKVYNLHVINLNVRAKQKGLCVQLDIWHTKTKGRTETANQE